MWAFATAATLTRHRHPDRPVWHLRAGTWIFAAAGAALNFTHGLTSRPAGPGLLPGGVGAGLVMAVVSVAGVTAHQLITAGPRRSRAERDQARIARAAARREQAVRRAAVRHAVAELGSDGNTRLIYTPGRATLARRYGRMRLEPVPGTDPDAHQPPDPDGRTNGSGGTGESPPAAAETGRAALVAGLAEEIRGAIDAGDRWRPDYGALMTRTGYGRSWCEKAVREARTAAFRTAAGDPAARTGTTSGAHGRTARPVLHAVDGGAG